MQRLRVVLLAGGVVALWACSTGTSTSSSSSGGSSSSSSSSSSSGGGSSGGSGTFTLGSFGYGEMHRDLPDGSPIMVVSGPQGGHHIWLSVGLPSGAVMESEGLEAEYRVQISGGAVVAEGRTYVAPRSMGSGMQDTGGMMFLDEAADPASFMDVLLEVDVTLKHQMGGMVATGHRQWTARCCSTGGGRGGEGNDADSGVVGGGGPGDCSEFCAVAAAPCGNGGAPLYPSSAACLTACNAVPAGGVVGFGAGNTLQCRVAYARDAQQDLGSCNRLGQSIEQFCVDSCTYYCRLMSDRCASTTFDGTCAAACEAWPAGNRGTVSGNNRACRIHYAEIAMPNPVEHCANASAGGGTACVP